MAAGQVCSPGQEGQWGTCEGGAGDTSPRAAATGDRGRQTDSSASREGCHEDFSERRWRGCQEPVVSDWNRHSCRSKGLGFLLGLREGAASTAGPSWGCLS